MSKLLSVISGSVYDASVYSGVQRFDSGQCPYVGQTAEYADGSKYVFVSSAVDVRAGDILAYATAQATPLDNLCTAAAIGATSVTINTVGVAFFGGSAGVIAANRLAGGRLIINDDTGENYSYRIASHTAGTASAAVVFTLEDPLIAAIDTTTDVVLVGPVYGNVVLGTGALQPLGVACVAAAGGTNTRTEYFWCQTAGPCGVRIETGTSIAVGKPAASDANGGCKIAGAATDLLIGTFLATDTTASAKVPVYLDLR